MFLDFDFNFLEQTLFPLVMVLLVKKQILSEKLMKTWNVQATLERSLWADYWVMGVFALCALVTLRPWTDAHGLLELRLPPLIILHIKQHPTSRHLFNLSCRFILVTVWLNVEVSIRGTFPQIKLFRNWHFMWILRKFTCLNAVDGVRSHKEEFSGGLDCCQVGPSEAHHQLTSSYKCKHWPAICRQAPLIPLSWTSPFDFKTSKSYSCNLGVILVSRCCPGQSVFLDWSFKSGIGLC